MKKIILVLVALIVSYSAGWSMRGNKVESDYAADCESATVNYSNAMTANHGRPEEAQTQSEAYQTYRHECDTH